MKREDYEAHLRAWEEYRNPGSTHAEAPRLRQPGEPRMGSSSSFVDDALLDDPERDRFREQLKKHDRLRKEAHKRTSSEERYPETLRSCLWDGEDVEGYPGTKRESIGPKRTSIPKHESRVLASSNATTDEGTMKCHGKARAPLSTDGHVVDSERRRSKLSVPSAFIHIADYGGVIGKTVFRLAQDQGYLFLTSSRHSRVKEGWEKAKIKAIKENHKFVRKCRKEKAARDAATLASVQILDPRPGSAHGMSSSWSAVRCPKDRKPSASSRTRPQASPIRTTPDAPSVRPAGPKDTKRERKTPDQRPGLVHRSRLSAYTPENKITPSVSRPSSHRESKSRKERLQASVADEMDSLLLEVGPETELPSLRREDAA